MKRTSKAAKSEGDNATTRTLSAEQLAKLRELTEPDRQVDETFDRTRIGSFLLSEHLIAPNPEANSPKAFIVTSEGRQLLKEHR